MQQTLTRRTSALAAVLVGAVLFLAGCDRPNSDRDMPITSPGKPTISSNPGQSNLPASSASSVYR